MKRMDRLNRISKILKKEIACIVQEKIRDPRLDMRFSISDIRISHDFSSAKVFFTYLDNRDTLAIKNGIFALNHASNFIRSILSKSILIRSTPVLKFFYDNSVLEGMHISHLIDTANNNDKKKSGI